MYHPSCKCSRCANETESRRRAGFSLRGGLYQFPMRGVDIHGVAGELTFKGDRPDARRQNQEKP